MPRKMPPGAGGENRTSVNIKVSTGKRVCTYILEASTEVTDGLFIAVFTLGCLVGCGA